MAQRVKEQHCYVCSDLAKEFAKHDKDPAKYIRQARRAAAALEHLSRTALERLRRRRRLFSQMSGVRASTAAPWSADVAYERFLAPEVFFQPEIYSSDFTTPLPEVVDRAIATSPIDTRRALYRNIVLSVRALRETAGCVVRARCESVDVFLWGGGGVGPCRAGARCLRTLGGGWSGT